MAEADRNSCKSWFLVICCLGVGATVGCKGSAPGNDTGGAFLSKHWVELPKANSEDIAPKFQLGSLVPGTCGSCHRQQLEDWQGSRHAQSVGPGLLVQFDGDPQGFSTCLHCHAPLLEQHPVIGNRNNPVFRKNLHLSGVSCASCHVRNGKVYGPPPRDKGAFKKAETGSIHGVFTADKAFEDSRFCSRCHQFKAGIGEFEGVPLENTFQEWKKSSFASKGISCQNCHMPDRRHLFRGIHDPKTTASGVSSKLERISGEEFRYTVTSVNIGHFFPTYVTPRVRLVIEAIDEKGNVVAKNEYVLQRRLDIYLEGQEYDQRLAPGKSAAVNLRVKKGMKIAKVKGYLWIEPDEFYHRFFLNYQVAHESLKPLLHKVLRETEESSYAIHQRELSL